MNTFDIAFTFTGCRMPDIFWGVGHFEKESSAVLKSHEYLLKQLCSCFWTNPNWHKKSLLKYLHWIWFPKYKASLCLSLILRFMHRILMILGGKLPFIKKCWKINLFSYSNFKIIDCLFLGIDRYFNFSIFVNFSCRRNFLAK